MNLTKAELGRFNSKWVESVKGCHEWQGPLDKDGYGTFYLRRINRRAHRVAYYSWFGDIPAGMVINHTCRNPRCVNPQHLQCVTIQENNKRDTNSIPYLNSQKTHCKRGHAFDRKYGNQRYCSICDREKQRRLRARWAAEDTLNV